MVEKYSFLERERERENERDRGTQIVLQEKVTPVFPKLYPGIEDGILLALVEANVTPVSK